MRNLFSVISLVSSLCLNALPSHAQEYHDIYSTSYTCAYFGDGTNQIFQKEADGNYELVTFEEASNGISKELAKQRKKLQTLNRQKKELPKSITDYDHLAAQLNKKIKKVQKLVTSRELELRALEDCRDDFRIDTSPTPFSFKPILGTRGDGSSFVSLLVTTQRKVGKNNDSERVYCFAPVEPTDDFYASPPQAKTFSTDPCVDRVSRSCLDVYFSKTTRLGFLYFFDTVNPNNPEEVNNAKDALLVTFANGFAGRPARNSFDDCQN